MKLHIQMIISCHDFEVWDQERPLYVVVVHMIKKKSWILNLSSQFPVLFWSFYSLCVSSFSLCLVSPPPTPVPHVFHLCSIIPASFAYISLSASLSQSIVCLSHVVGASQSLLSCFYCLSIPCVFSGLAFLQPFCNPAFILFLSCWTFVHTFY